MEPSRSKSGHSSRVSRTLVAMGTKMQIPKMSFSGEGLLCSSRMWLKSMDGQKMIGWRLF